MGAWDSDVTLIVEISPGEGPFETPVWVAIDADVRSINTDRQVSQLLDETQASDAHIVLGNRSGDYDPGNTGGTHYPGLKVGTPIRVRATENLITYDLYRGYVNAWKPSYPSVMDAIVTVTCLDAFTYFARYEDELTESEELSGTRIGNLLDTVGWPAGWRALDAGSHNMAALSAEFDSILNEIRRASLVEQGLFYIAGNGNATFRDATTRIEDRTVQATFSDDGADLSYSFPEPSYDDDQLYNEAHITRVDGVTQTVTDSASVTAHGHVDLHLSETLHVSDGEANSLASWITSENADIRKRIEQIILYPMKDPTNLWPVALGLDFWDLVNVEHTPPSSSTQDDFYFVQGITHEISKLDGMRWDVTLQLGQDLRHGADYWILGTSQLGTDTRLGY